MAMIRERLEVVGAKLRESLWFIPALMTVGAIGLSILTAQIDDSARVPEGTFWSLLGASAVGARSVLETIAGSIMTVTGVVFSITVVALQLASSQYTPRVLRAFTDDRATQIVLGTFIATFTYSLLALRVIRADAESFEAFLPGVTVAVAVLFGVASIAALIFFVNHIAHAIRVETVIERITREVLARIDALYPSKMGDPAEEPRFNDEVPEATGQAGALIVSDCGGYLQNVDDDSLLAIARSNDLLLRTLVPIGAFVIDGDPLATIQNGELEPHVEERIRGSFHIGSERTLLQDVMRGMVELTDVALRALSPSLNDPTTAMACIDRLTQVGVRLVSRRFPSPYRTDADGTLRVIAVPATFEELIHLPYGQLRLVSVDHPAVAHRLITSLARLAEAAPPERIAPILRELEELQETIRTSVAAGADRNRLERDASDAITTMRRSVAAPAVAGARRPEEQREAWE